MTPRDGAGHTQMMPVSSKVRVLLVGRQVLCRAGLRCLLDDCPAIEVVGEASGPEDAIPIVRAAKADVAVLDVDALDGSGLDATRAMAAMPNPPFILALASLPEEEGVVDALRAGASGYLPKNAEAGEFVTAIQTVAGGELFLRPQVGRLLATAVRRPATISVSESRAKFEELSEREREVLRLVAQGCTGPEIGRALGITAKTVDTYRHRIHAKIGLAHRKDYVRFALTIGLLSPRAQ
jgi:DNA-binding NarL/FixJ family response regulator